MHDQLAESLGVEVVGEVTKIGGGFFDVGLGRICLEFLDRERIEQLLAQLRSGFGTELTIRDRLHLDDPRQIVRGIVEVDLRDPQTGNPYLLQITSKTLCELYERRFIVASDTMGDLMGTVGNGLCALVGAGMETSLRILSDHDGLLERYLERLDVAVQASIAGSVVEPGLWVEELIEPLARAWKLLPWALRSRLRPISRAAGERVCRHDRVLRNTLLFAVDLVSGEQVYSYVHQPHELEEYDQVMGWITDIYLAIRESYPEPAHGNVMARASSVETFLDHYPGLRGIVGSAPDPEATP